MSWLLVRCHWLVPFTGAVMSARFRTTLRVVGAVQNRLREYALPTHGQMAREVLPLPTWAILVFEDVLPLLAKPADTHDNHALPTHLQVALYRTTRTQHSG